MIVSQARTHYTIFNNKQRTILWFSWLHRRSVLLHSYFTGVSTLTSSISTSIFIYIDHVRVPTHCAYHNIYFAGMEHIRTHTHTTLHAEHENLPFFPSTFRPFSPCSTVYVHGIWLSIIHPAGTLSLMQYQPVYNRVEPIYWVTLGTDNVRSECFRVVNQYIHTEHPI